MKFNNPFLKYRRNNYKLVFGGFQIQIRLEKCCEISHSQRTQLFCAFAFYEKY